MVPENLVESTLFNYLTLLLARANFIEFSRRERFRFYVYIKCIYIDIYEGNSLNNRNFILKCMEKWAQRKILFRDTKGLLSNMSYRGHDDQAV